MAPTMMRASVGGQLVGPVRVLGQAHDPFSHRLHHAHHVLHGHRGQTCAWRRKQRQSVSRPSSLISIPRLGPFICCSCSNEPAAADKL